MANPIDTPFNLYLTIAEQTIHDVSSEGSAAHRQTQLQPNKLQYLQLSDWDEHNSYNEVPPSCLHYWIEWKVTVNNKVISKDTEQDLVLAPTAHWHVFLQTKLEKLPHKKLAQNRHIRCDDTNVIMSVTCRSERGPYQTI